MTRAVFAVIVILLVAGSSAAFAQDSGFSRSMKRSQAERAMKDSKTVMGKVAEITASKVVIENDYGAKKELKLNSKTKFRLSEKKSTKLDAIKPGALVNVTFRPADLTATRVQQTVKKFQE